MYICNTNIFRCCTILLFDFNTGFCALFSMTDRRIINDPALDCTKFVPPCPTRFPSNESFKCKLQSSSNRLLYVFLTGYNRILICSLLLF